MEVISRFPTGRFKRTTSYHMQIYAKGRESKQSREYYQNIINTETMFKVVITCLFFMFFTNKCSFVFAVSQFCRILNHRRIKTDTLEALSFISALNKEGQSHPIET